MEGARDREGLEVLDVSKWRCCECFAELIFLGGMVHERKIS